MKRGNERHEVPKEGKWFEIKPKSINRDLFEQERPNRRQEHSRKLIKEAFEEWEKNIEKYGEEFETLIPERKDADKNSNELKAVAEEYGGHMADWVEQALEWAQRISNGERWEDVCNIPDDAKWFRAIIWKNGYVRNVGGARKANNYYPPSDVDFFNFGPNRVVKDTVPLVARKKVH